MTKPRPNRLGMYADLSPILDAALVSGGGSYTLPSYGAAVHWRQRAYKFRKLYAETMGGMSKYDRLTLPRIEDGTSVVTIKLSAPKGLFTPNESPALAPFAEDELFGAAEEFAKKLGGEV